MKLRLSPLYQRPDDDLGGGGGGGDNFDLGSEMESIASELGDKARVDDETPAPAPTSAAPTPPAPTPPAPKAEETPAPTPSPSPAPRPRDINIAPNTWKAEVQAEWAKLPESVRAEIHRREDDFHNGVEVYKADAQFARSIKPALEPFMPILKQYNIDPAAQVHALMRAHHTLALGSPEQKSAMIQQLIKDYQIKLPSAAPAPTPDGEPAFVDPEVASLRQEIEQLRSQLNGTTEAVSQERRQKLVSEIQEFASKPENEHFDTVADDIATLLRAKPGMTLREAYDQAVWLNPVTRTKLLEKQAADAAAAQEKARKDAAERKRLDDLNARTKARQASAGEKTGSIDDTLAETLAAIEARGS
ncbi:MAG: hypothetical protein AB7U98_13560 [Candidatus Nitrosocosmicus sp.]